MVKECPGEGWEDITACKGIWKKTIRPAPEGAAKPREGSYCNINYEYFYQDERFDKSDDDGPLEVIPGSGMTTTGMEEGILSLAVGEKARFMFDPLFSFRENGFPPKVPAHAIVELEMELVDFIGPWTEEQKIRAAADFKQAGNALFKEKNFRGALKKYNRGLDVIGRRKRALPPGQKQHEAGQHEVRLSTLQNVMLCWHQIGIASGAEGDGARQRALDFASQLIRMDPANPKARFRMARHEAERHNYYQARDHLAALDSVEDPAVRKEVAMELRKLSERERTAKQKERAASARMTKAFGQAEAETTPEKAPATVHADPGASESQSEPRASDDAAPAAVAP